MRNSAYKREGDLGYVRNFRKRIGRPGSTPVIFAALGLLLCGIIFCGEAKGLDLYFVRHAETVANATGQYTKKAQETFSKEGESQISDLTKSLNGYKFDVICVSPQKRAINTILPYLRKNNATAEIWPELDECCYQDNRNVQPSAAAFANGASIVLDAKDQKYLRLRDPAMKYFYADGNYADGMLRIQKARDLLIERFGRSESSILIVGHYLSGGRLIEMLMGLKSVGKQSPGNARLWHLREKPDGTFELIRFNIYPAEKYLE
ncbi:MAG: histidine phosphatase family protein [Candidatus Omnitrophica bacterium]|nr:histidine phosphatase family protein [Candidatus Omnitrophota bacterium]MBU4488755.1 histidine phosphatase family protein [Candidatus Omnitrophota bacterium]MCG2705852.1 histidine phosphatase family protein [Candidatus Omnitrophota bacterium]